MIYLNLTEGYNPLESQEQETIKWIEEDEGGKPKFRLESTFGSTDLLVVTTKLDMAIDLFRLQQAMIAVEHENKAIDKVLFVPDYSEEDELRARVIAGVINQMGFNEVATQNFKSNDLKLLTEGILEIEMIEFITDSLVNVEGYLQQEDDENPVAKPIIISVEDEEEEYVSETAALLGLEYSRFHYIPTEYKDHFFFGHKIDEKDRNLVIITEKIDRTNVDKINKMIMKLSSLPIKEVSIITIHLNTDDIDYDFISAVYTTDSYEIDISNPKNFLIKNQ